MRKYKPSGVYVTENDFSSAEISKAMNTSLLIGKSGKGPINVPIYLSPKTKPVKWYQFWRYKDIEKRKEEVKWCKEKTQELFGNPEKLK